MAGIKGSLASLAFPSGWYDQFVHLPPAIREFKRMLIVRNSDEILFVTRRGGILRPWLNPPSLKRLAAEAVVRAYPSLKMSMIEEATGIDLSDGLPYEHNEEDAAVVYL